MRKHKHYGSVGRDHIDQSGHVNYKAYPSLFEAGQDKYLADRWTSFDELERAYGIRSVVLVYSINITSSLSKGENYFIETMLRLGNTSLVFTQTMTKDRNVPVATMDMTVSLVRSENMREKVRIPDDLRAQLMGR